MKYLLTVYLAFGCIIFSNAQDKLELIKECQIIESNYNGKFRSAFCENCNFWPNGIVPFEFHNNVNAENIRLMQEAMSLWEEVANIQFIPRSTEVNFIRIIDTNENSSAVGMQDSVQELRIFNWNSPMTICHELAHALGFWHEQSRPDRDLYVVIDTSLVCDGSEHNFDIQNSGITPNIPYDFNSIMHYSSTAFRRCIDPLSDCDMPCERVTGHTISILHPFQNNIIGNRSRLSNIDRLLMSFIYPFPNFRFVNREIINTNGRATHLYNAAREITSNIVNSKSIPADSNIWIMPGQYDNSKGIYSKQVVLNAPFGGVILH